MSYQTPENTCEMTSKIHTPPLYLKFHMGLNLNTIILCTTVGRAAEKRKTFALNNSVLSDSYHRI